MPFPLRARLNALRKRRSRGSSDRPVGHLEENRQYWDSYAEHWTGEFRGFESAPAEGEPGRYEHLGDEWGHPQHVQQILDGFVFPYIDERTIALEIGSGGGRIAVQVAPRVKHLYCVDISEKMLRRAEAALGACDNVSFVRIDGAQLPGHLLSAEVDFVYSFDVFVHLDLHTMWRYVSQVADVLRPGGRAFLHTTNLLTEAGWDRFAAQSEYSLEGHYFISPQILDRLAEKAGLRIERRSDEDPTNFYKARDLLALLRK